MASNNTRNSLLNHPPDRPVPVMLRPDIGQALLAACERLAAWPGRVLELLTERHVDDLDRAEVAEYVARREAEAQPNGRADP